MVEPVLQRAFAPRYRETQLAAIRSTTLVTSLPVMACIRYVRGVRHWSPRVLEILEGVDVSLDLDVQHGIECPAKGGWIESLKSRRKGRRHSRAG